MNNTLYAEYDNLLVGRISEIDTGNFYGSEPSEANRQIALSLVKYAIEDVLRWDRQTAVRKFDEYIIRVMKLDGVLRFIDFPPEVPDGNARYILSLIYPGEMKMNQESLCLDTFKNVIECGKKQWPRDYFAGGIGFQRFCFCLKYLIEHYRPFTSVDEMYNFFLSPAGRKFLVIYRLQTPVYQFSIDICKALRYITKDHPDSELYYTYYTFRTAMEKAGKAVR